MNDMYDDRSVSLSVFVVVVMREEREGGVHIFSQLVDVNENKLWNA